MSCKPWRPKSKSVFTTVHRYTLEEFWRLPTIRSFSLRAIGDINCIPPPDPPHGSMTVKSLIRFQLEKNIPGEIHHPREPIGTDARAGTYLEQT
jgi:hypothetical protein